jgi:hypothetical protein
MILLPGSLLALLALANAAAPQEGAPPQEPSAQPAPPSPASQAAQGAPRHTFELSLSQDSVWLEARRYARNGRDFTGLSLFADDDDVYAGRLQVMRFAEPRDPRIQLGLGLGFYALYDDDEDADAYAVALIANAGYALQTKYPTSVIGELAYAPDITTFGDGEDLVDLSVTLQAELSTSTAAYFTYRLLEADLEDGGDIDVIDGLRVGIRVGL